MNPDLTKKQSKLIPENQKWAVLASKLEKDDIWFVQ